MACVFNAASATVSLDFASEDTMRAVTVLVDDIAAAVRRGGCVTLDLSAVMHLDGAGMGAIAYLYRRMRAGGRDVRLGGVRGQPLAYLTDLGLARTFDLPAAQGLRGAPRFGLARAA